MQGRRADIRPKYQIWSCKKQKLARDLAGNSVAIFFFLFFLFSFASGDNCFLLLLLYDIIGAFSTFSSSCFSKALELALRPGRCGKMLECALASGDSLIFFLRNYFGCTHRSYIVNNRDFDSSVSSSIMMSGCTRPCSIFITTSRQVCLIPPEQSSRYYAATSFLTVSNILDGTMLINVYVQPVWFEIHSLHRVGPEDTVLLWEIGLCEGLAIS